MENFLVGLVLGFSLGTTLAFSLVRWAIRRK
jgi:hypothetical protein